MNENVNILFYFQVAGRLQTLQKSLNNRCGQNIIMSLKIHRWNGRILQKEHQILYSFLNFSAGWEF